MGLPHGCTQTADGLFAKRYATDQMHVSNNTVCSILMDIPKIHVRLDLTYVRGDCTACTAYLECLQLTDVPTMFTAIQEYMSINARISCLFTLKKKLKEIPEWIKELKKFPIMGLHVQKSNREPNNKYYMITGILKVPNPFINTYDAFNKEYPNEHNNNDIAAINKINSQLGLQIL